MTQIQESPQKQIDTLQTQEEVQDTLQTQGEIQDTLQTQGEVQNKKNFAAMNGVKTEIAENKEIEPQEIPQPEEIVTTRTASQNPLLKMGVIGGGILLFIVLIGGVINGSMNALNLATTKKIEPSKNSQLEESEVEVKDETGETKTALALTSQNLEFKKIRDQKAQVEPTPTPTPTPVAVAPPPPPPSPPKVQATRTVPTQPVPPPRRHTTPSPAPVLTVPSVPSTATQAKAPPVDPMQQWIAVSNIGHYGTSEPTDLTSLASSNELEDFESIQGGSGSKFVDKQVSNQNFNSNPDHSGKRVLVGSRVEGSLETPIAWSINTQQENQNYLIRLTKPLQAFDSTEVLPVGSYIVARLNSSNESGYVQMHAVSALINTDGKTEEKSIPENSVLILGKNGKLLKAKSQRGNELGGSFMASVLSGVAKAAEIQNRPTSQSTINSIGVSTVTTTSNDEKNLVAGFAEGSLNEMVRRMQSSNQQRLQQMQSEPIVFVLESGTSVQLFVNQTISL